MQKSLAQELNGFYSNQFYNIHNHVSHYETTGPEIWRQTDNNINVFVATSGTGGTIGGCSLYLKQQNPNIRCYLVDIPGQSFDLEKLENNSFYTLRDIPPEKKIDTGSSLMEGIGSSSLYYPLSQSQLDGKLYVSDIAGVKMCNQLLKNDALFLGGSSGMNCVAAYLIAKKFGPGQTIVTILPDGGSRYTSKIFNKNWLKEKNLYDEEDNDIHFIDSLIENGSVKIFDEIES